MHRARFAEKAGAEMREHLVGREQDAPEAVGVVAVVGGVRVVLIEWDAISDLARHCRNAYVDPEFAKRGDGELKLGHALAAGDVFTLGDQVDVSGVSKGHGYAGVIKRHHFAGFPGSHGTHEYFRHGGSIGNRSYPGRVRKGMRMAGQMGNVKATTVNLKVVEILPDDNAILVSGCVPGADGTLVIVRHSAKSRRVALEAKANG